ncbi:hypothetical protein AB6A40_003404 [Gnathostoma spinigerum]|uniref:Ephrin RBD domain-containing protein n=1 Tax=Gnathostoma spinigerum TaxID=75299 RepID=A0ABD6EKA1_9BILA
MRVKRRFSETLLLLFWWSVKLCCSARRLPDFYWNSSNPIFGNEGPKHVTLEANIMDTIVIRCPYFDESTHIGDTEQMVIYRVSYYGYQSCVVDETAKQVGRCSHPHEKLTIRTTFRRYTPLPSGLEYAPGNSYYFISTSDGTPEGIEKKVGGLCHTKKMRLRIFIRPNNPKGIRQLVESTSPLPQPPPPFNGPYGMLTRNIPAPEIIEPWRRSEVIAGLPPIWRNSSGVYFLRTFDMPSATTEAPDPDPGYKLFEVHEEDEYAHLPLSSSTLHLPSTLLIVLLLLRITF